MSQLYATVLTLTAVVPLLAMWAAYVTTALAAESNLRDRTQGRTVWVLLKPEPIAVPEVRRAAA